MEDIQDIRKEYSIAKLLTHHKLLEVIIVQLAHYDSSKLRRFVSALVNVMGYHHDQKVWDLISLAVGIEVKNQRSSGTLFRSNSPATLLISAYVKKIGGGFIKQSLSSWVLGVYQDISGGQSFEVNPENVDSEEQLAENISHVKRHFEYLMTAIFRCIYFCPRQFREIALLLQNSIIDMFPDDVSTVVSGFFFLRYICPALISPESYGLLSEPPSMELRSAFILISKILQNIANRQNFDTKEPYLRPFNSLFDEYSDLISVFCTQLSQIPDNIPLEVNIKVSLEEYKETIQFLSVELRKLGIDKLLESLNDDYSEKTEYLIQGLLIYDAISMIQPEDELRMSETFKTALPHRFKKQKHDLFLKRTNTSECVETEKQHKEISPLLTLNETDFEDPENERGFTLIESSPVWTQVSPRTDKSEPKNFLIRAVEQ